MNTVERKAYHKGYVEGYLAGVRDTKKGCPKIYDTRQIETLPIGIMEISTRGLNCLVSAGCLCVGDVASLDPDAVRSMRNMGKKTAAEIAGWLDEHHIYSSTWNRYLL